MTFANRARAAQQLRKGGTCTVGVMLDGMDEKLRAEVETAIDDLSIYATIIADLLTKDGYEMTPETLNRHRRGRCLCR